MAAGRPSSPLLSIFSVSVPSLLTNPFFSFFPFHLLVVKFLITLPVGLKMSVKVYSSLIVKIPARVKDLLRFG